MLLRPAAAARHAHPSEGSVLEADVHAVPPAISDRVARHKLRAIGVRWDDLTDRQLAYLSSWRSGT